MLLVLNRTGQQLRVDCSDPLTVCHKKTKESHSDDASELMLGLHVFRQTGPLRGLDCLAPPPVCHMKMEASRYVPCSKAQQASFTACSPHYLYVLSVKQGSCEYHFLVLWYDSTWGTNPRSTDCEADALTTTPSRLLMPL